MAKALIIVPTQGADVASFSSVALALKREVYGGSATIVQTTVSADLTVLFEGLGGGAFSFPAVSGVSTALTISHAFSADGPNLAYTAGGYQPWGSVGGLGNELTPQARAFWEQVGGSLRARGKIILLGCNMGLGQYAALVSAAAGHAVYASTSYFGAGDSRVAVPYVRDIENGVVRRPMKRF